MILKSQIEEMRRKLGDKAQALYVELYLESNGRCYLKANTDSGQKTIGRVSKKIFNWYDLQLMDRPALNVAHYKFPN